MWSTEKSWPDAFRASAARLLLLASRFRRRSRSAWRYRLRSAFEGPPFGHFVDAVLGSSTGGTTDFVAAFASRRSVATAGSRAAFGEGFSFAFFEPFPFGVFSFFGIGGAEDTPSCGGVNGPSRPVDGARRFRRARGRP